MRTLLHSVTTVRKKPSRQQKNRQQQSNCSSYLTPTMSISFYRTKTGHENVLFSRALWISLQVCRLLWYWTNGVVLPWKGAVSSLCRIHMPTAGQSRDARSITLWETGAKWDLCSLPASLQWLSVSEVCAELHGLHTAWQQPRKHQWGVNWSPSCD